MQTLLQHRAVTVLVDNNSSDGTAAAAHAAFPDLSVLTLPRNVGAFGRTVGARAAYTRVRRLRRRRLLVVPRVPARGGRHPCLLPRGGRRGRPDPGRPAGTGRSNLNGDGPIAPSPGVVRAPHPVGIRRLRHRGPPIGLPRRRRVRPGGPLPRRRGTGCPGPGRARSPDRLRRCPERASSPLAPPAQPGRSDHCGDPLIDSHHGHATPRSIVVVRTRLAWRSSTATRRGQPGDALLGGGHWVAIACVAVAAAVLLGVEGGPCLDRCAGSPTGLVSRMYPSHRRRRGRFDVHVDHDRVLTGPQVRRVRWLRCRSARYQCQSPGNGIPTPQGPRSTRDVRAPRCPATDLSPMPHGDPASKRTASFAMPTWRCSTWSLVADGLRQTPDLDVQPLRRLVTNQSMRHKWPRWPPGITLVRGMPPGGTVDDPGGLGAWFIGGPRRSSPVRPVVS